MSHLGAGLALPAVCQGCGERGDVLLDDRSKPSWCRCGGRCPGPYQAPPGHVTAFVYGAEPAPALRARGRAAWREYYDARDALAGRWVRCGSGWRELPKASPRRRALERRFRLAQRGIDELRADCTHPVLSAFQPGACAICGTVVTKKRGAA